MSKQLHSLQRERKEWEKKERMEKTQPTKMKETFMNGPILKKKKKKSKRLQKKSYSVCKANEFFFSKHFQTLPYLFSSPSNKTSFWDTAVYQSLTQTSSGTFKLY